MMMTRVLLVLGVLVSGIGAGAALSRGNASPAQATAAAARVSVTLPQADAELAVDGTRIDGGGINRDVPLPALAPRTTRQVTFTATWQPNSYTTMTRSKTVTLRAGEPASVDLAVEAPEDRVRVIYVPTPYDISEEMVRIAGVTRDDVVFEPGCGDARITIAAIKAGARRGICVDIEADRVAESRANVKAAGFADRIDVRLGDALDVKDLKEVTVVFLYMGDHFNMLIRPVLWRDLRTGSRIVSHRFTMGDWRPDRTSSVNSSEGGVYDLHLWTITEAVKRGLTGR